jgi:hypothetical protein
LACKEDPKNWNKLAGFDFLFNEKHFARGFW